jgi:hypothetical protein
MTETPTKTGEAFAILRAGGALTLEQLKALGIQPEDVDQKWMDEMVKRLFHEMKKQLSQLEAAKAASDTAEHAGRRGANARSLIALERTLERLVALEQRRVLNRDVKVAKSDDDIRAEIERKLDQCLAERQARGLPEKSDG